MDCSFGWFICQISTVVGELPDLKKGFLDFMVDMGHHGVIGVHNNTQVSNSFWRRYTGLSDLNVVQMYRWAKFWAENYHHFSFRVIWVLAYFPSTNHGCHQSKFPYSKLSDWCQMPRKWCIIDNHPHTCETAFHASWLCHPKAACK